jgi:hypothetical protein
MYQKNKIKYEMNVHAQTNLILLVNTTNLIFEIHKNEIQIKETVHKEL